MKIQQELDETKIVLHKTIESMLERGENIDNLVARSEGLSTASKMFYTQVRGQTVYSDCARPELMATCAGQEAELVLRSHLDCPFSMDLLSRQQVKQRTCCLFNPFVLVPRLIIVLSIILLHHVLAIFDTFFFVLHT